MTENDIFVLVGICSGYQFEEFSKHRNDPNYGIEEGISQLFWEITVNFNKIRNVIDFKRTGEDSCRFFIAVIEMAFGDDMVYDAGKFFHGIIWIFYQNSASSINQQLQLSHLYVLNELTHDFILNDQNKEIVN